MFYFNTLNLNQISGGNQVKQGDFGSTFAYKLADEKGQELGIFNQKTAYVNLVLDDNIVFTTTSIVDKSTVTFHIDKALPIGLYFLEIKIDSYIFPSDRQTIILVEAGAVAYDLKDLVPNYDTNMTITGILSDLSQKGIDISELKTKIAKNTNDISTMQPKISDLQNNVTNLQNNKANKSFVDSQFASIVSGAPKGTFATLSALQSAYPNGTEGVFLVLENGHWYYYASGWKDGGMYQATQIEDESLTSEKYKDDSITSSKTTFRTINNNKNVLDVDEVYDNVFWDANGIKKTSDTTQGTALINCDGMTTVVQNNYSYNSFYNADGIFISGFINSDVNMTILGTSIPEGAHTMRSSINKSMNPDYTNLYIILTNDVQTVVNNLNDYRQVEYFDEKLRVTDENFQNFDVVKKSELLEVSEIDGIVLPSKVFTTGKEVLSWLNTIMPSKKITEVKVSFSTGATEWGNRVYNFDEFNWGVVPNNTIVTVYFSSDDELKYSKTITVNKKITNPVTKSINTLPIGDSITNRGFANSLNNYLAVLYGMTPTSVGTMINMFNQRGEGREGWKFTNFIGKSWTTQTGHTMTVAAAPIDNQLAVNPFLKVATESDKSIDQSYCFTTSGVSYEQDNTKEIYYIFDFANYIAVQGIAMPDVITIALSTNDILSGSPTYMTDCNEALLFMIKKIREVSTTVKIGVIPTFNFGMDATGNELQAKALKWVKECVTSIDTLNDSNTNIIPSYIMVDRLSAFPTSTTAVTSNTNIVKTSIVDRVHTQVINSHAAVTAQWVVNVLN